jgi:hypothetical protein
VAVRDNHATDRVEPVHDVLEIRDDVIDPQHVVFWEHDANINDNAVQRVFSLILDEHHVLTDLAEATQRHDTHNLLIVLAAIIRLFAS